MTDTRPRGNGLRRSPARKRDRDVDATTHSPPRKRRVGGTPSPLDSPPDPPTPLSSSTAAEQPTRRARGRPRNTSDLLCATCGKSFAHRGHYNVHVRRHSHLAGQLPGTHICARCDRAFLTRSEFVRHTYIHEEPRRYPCPKENCTAAFVERNKLHLHLLRHEKARPQPCPFGNCDQSFLTRYQQRKHIEHAHSPAARQRRELLRTSVGALRNSHTTGEAD